MASSLSEVSPQKPEVGVDIPPNADEKDQTAESQFAGGMKKSEDAENNDFGDKEKFNQNSASTRPQTEPSRVGGRPSPANAAAPAGSHPGPANAAAPDGYIPHEQKFKIGTYLMTSNLQILSFWTSRPRNAKFGVHI